MRLYSNDEWFREMEEKCKERSLVPLILVALAGENGPTFTSVELLKMGVIDNDVQADVLEDMAAMLRQNGRHTK